ncbi:hypothetical protein EPA93_07715 [Ktedonosporobacter rubrisoli]|uniref:Uncharacterized protein n=1 Tax=Ktedonosporobacter rubrisoli TaxID=2509675 RepID=A0A4V0YYE1_KTERU|nr:hypothetical protein [Ktedonosporobacter rubrisoli]QBD75901.1 hypothetical protein EPA93_07715 [Ktedonosporobacter rubrisoli]
MPIARAMMMVVMAATMVMVMLTPGTIYISQLLPIQLYSVIEFGLLLLINLLISFGEKFHCSCPFLLSPTFFVDSYRFFSPRDFSRVHASSVLASNKVM